MLYSFLTDPVGKRVNCLNIIPTTYLTHLPHVSMLHRFSLESSVIAHETFRSSIFFLFPGWENILMNQVGKIFLCKLKEILSHEYFFLLFCHCRSLFWTEKLFNIDVRWTTNKLSRQEWREKERNFNPHTHLMSLKIVMKGKKECHRKFSRSLSSSSHVLLHKFENKLSAIFLVHFNGSTKPPLNQKIKTFSSTKTKRVEVRWRIKISCGLTKTLQQCLNSSGSNKILFLLKNNELQIKKS